MKLYFIEIDTEGNPLPEDFKIEHFIQLGVAKLIALPTSFQEGLIMQYIMRDVEKVIYVHSEKLFEEIISDFHGVESMLSWAIMDAKIAKKLANYS